MELGEYRAAVVEGFRSIFNAAAQWKNNPLVSDVNHLLWGRWWVVTLGLVTIAFITLEFFLPPLTALAGLFPPLAMATFAPGVVADLLISAPAFFAFVVVWRVRRLRSTSREMWPGRTRVPDFGASLFDAGAVPVAVATVVLAIGGYAGHSLAAAAEGVPVPGAGGPARTVLTVALAAGILGVHQKIGTGLGKLLGAGFFVWGMHLAIGFSVPWMVSWTAYLPVIGQYAPQRSPDLVVLIFNLAVACAAWTAAREKCRAAPLWCDEQPSPPPPPPPPPPEDND